MTEWEQHHSGFSRSKIRGSGKWIKFLIKLRSDKERVLVLKLDLLLLVWAFIAGLTKVRCQSDADVQS